MHRARLWIYRCPGVHVHHLIGRRGQFVNEQDPAFLDHRCLHDNTETRRSRSRRGSGLLLHSDNQFLKGDPSLGRTLRRDAGL